MDHLHTEFNPNKLTNRVPCAALRCKHAYVCVALVAKHHEGNGIEKGRLPIEKYNALPWLLTVCKHLETAHKHDCGCVNKASHRQGTKCCGEVFESTHLSGCYCSEQITSFYACVVLLLL